MLQQLVDTRVLETLLPLLSLRELLCVGQVSYNNILTTRLQTLVCYEKSVQATAWCLQICTDLRQLVTDAPGSAWHAAAERSVPASHPLAWSGCDKAAALRHAAVRQAFRDGRFCNKCVFAGQVSCYQPSRSCYSPRASPHAYQSALP